MKKKYLLVADRADKELIGEFDYLEDVRTEMEILGCLGWVVIKKEGRIITPLYVEEPDLERTEKIVLNQKTTDKWFKSLFNSVADMRADVFKRLSDKNNRGMIWSIEASM